MPQSAPHGRAGLFSHGSESSVSGLQVAPIGQPAWYQACMGDPRAVKHDRRIEAGRVMGRAAATATVASDQLLVCAELDKQRCSRGLNALRSGRGGNSSAPSLLNAVLVPVALQTSAHCDGA